MNILKLQTYFQENRDMVIIITVILIITLYYLYSTRVESDEWILIEMDNCGFCKKQKELFQNSDNTVKIRTINSNTSEAKKLIDKHNIDGFPSIVYKDKVSIGYKSISDHQGTFDDHTIIMIGNDSCPFCQKMKTFLNKELGEGKYQTIDSNTADGKKYMEDGNATGVPLLYSRKTDKYSVGYSEDCLKTLDSPKHDITLVGTPKCPYCVKMRDLLDSKLGLGKFNLIDSETVQGKELMEINFAKGVPLVLNVKNGKKYIGFSDNVLDEII